VEIKIASRSVPAPADIRAPTASSPPAGENAILLTIERLPAIFTPVRSSKREPE
jgi:hypothetical protein